MSQINEPENLFKNREFNKKYYRYIISTELNAEKKEYQIIINGEKLSSLIFLKNNTGLTFRQLTSLCLLKLKETHSYIR